MSDQKLLKVLDLVRPIADWETEYLGENRYRITPKADYIGQTGSQVTTEFIIRFPHKLIRLDFKHTDSSKAEATTTLSFSLQSMMKSGLWHDIYENTGISVSDVSKIFDSKKRNYPAQLYRILTNTTSTHRVYPELVVEVVVDE